MSDFKDNIYFIIKITAMLLMLYGSFTGGKESQKSVSNEQLKNLGQLIQILTGNCKP
jgi:glucose uptake protein GlcU